MKKELWRYVGSGNLHEFVKMSNDAVKQYGESFDCWYESSYVCGEEIIHYFVKLGECDPIERRLSDAYKKNALGVDPARGNDETVFVWPPVRPPVWPARGEHKAPDRMIWFPLAWSASPVAVDTQDVLTNEQLRSVIQDQTGFEWSLGLLQSMNEMDLTNIARAIERAVIAQQKRNKS